jgi:hypothetical protein
MQERITPESYFNFQPSMAERARVFIGDKMSQGDRDTAANIAESFQNPDKPMADTAVLIPVAAHQDGKHIFHTMEQYANQRGNKPFTVFLHLNAPFDTAPLEEVEFTIRETERAKDAFPHLDVRYDTMYYEDEPIGGIRRNLWNAAFLLAHHEGKTDSEIIGMNHDIDTQYISPHYIARVQRHYDMQRRRAGQVGVTNYIAHPVHTRVTHAVSKNHPNIGKVTTWIDNSYFQDPAKVGYEAGMIIPFSHYTDRGGFRAYSKTHETSWVHDPFQKTAVPYLAGAQLYTSPRRYIDRLQEFGSDNIWSNDSFTDTDNCRETLREDITHDQAEEHIIDRLDRDIMYHWLTHAMHPIYDAIKHESILRDLSAADRAQFAAEGTEAVTRQLAKAQRLLRKVIKSEILADLVAESYDSREYSSSQVESVANWYAFEKTHDGSKLLTLR